jgi:hypothetical protein
MNEDENKNPTVPYIVQKQCAIGGAGCYVLRSGAGCAVLTAAGASQLPSWRETDTRLRPYPIDEVENFSHNQKSDMSFLGGISLFRYRVTQDFE